ncbi:MAG: alpha,alpha-trehalose-phosphate synthase (UDP-forming), partial [Stellaceae bacterium]
MPIIVVSNRVSPPQGRASLPGGLAVVMREALWKNGGIWFGWSGTVTESAASAPPTRLAQGPLTYVTVDLTRAEYEKYYLGFSNATLWPTLHYRLGLIEFDGGQYEEYLRVNTRLARLLAPMIGADDIIWVHDYHLIPMGAALRRLGIGNPIGFFLHTPFPAAEVFSALPRHDELLCAMAAYDLVGFQTEASRTAFRESIVRLAAGEALDDGRFLAYGRRSRAGVFPVGIDAEAFARAAAQSAEAEPASELGRLADSLRGRSLILGVDRLDYSKGIAQRFGAIELLLEGNPEYRRRFQYLQVTPCSREEVPQYRALRRQLEGAAGRINGKFAECDWS